MEHHKRIKVLLVEDNPDDAVLMQRALRPIKGGDIKVTWSPSLSSALENLASETYDVVVTDLGLPESNGIESFLKLHARYPEVPIIVLTGLSDEKAALEAVQKGAQDYLVKGQVDGAFFVQAIRYAIERQKLLTQLEQSLKDIRRLEGLIPMCAWCRQIRDDRGYWKKVETYIEERTDASFSHGICPECLRKNYPETFEKARSEQPEILDYKTETSGRGQDNHAAIRLRREEDADVDILDQHWAILSFCAHDIRNSVVSSAGQLTRILKDGAGSLQGDLSAIADRLQSVEGLLANFVEFSRFKERKYSPVTAAFDLPGAIRKQIEAMQISAASKAIAISCDFPDGPFPAVLADGDMLQKVIANLLDNAVNFTDNGGTISVRLSITDKDVVFQVWDTGIGITEDQLPHVFKAFYRANASSRCFGLGLSIAKTIIEAHGGVIWVESVPGQGSVVSFTLPR
ncbi:MAG: hybrid sensor histidine kinase/response regulator [Thermodesulfovibrionales bacterium]